MRQTQKDSIKRREIVSRKREFFTCGKAVRSYRVVGVVVEHFVGQHKQCLGICRYTAISAAIIIFGVESTAL